MSIRLNPTPLVRKIFTTLLDALKIFPPPAANGKEVVMRVAGGWVRDHVIEHLKGNVNYNDASPDLDIALDCITGVQFAECVNKYLEMKGEELHSVGIIRLNPDQSKHLEVAILVIDNMKIDCLQLRTEEYADSSRIPEVRFGTPAEDAMRRDFACNALFYNINRDEVEDFTGRGINDIRLKRLVTPIDPFITLTDDPLRALRGVRFACRLGFTIDDEILKITKTKEYRNCLALKVSRERIGCEIDSAIRSGSVLCAYTWMHKMEILDIIFAPQAVWGEEYIRHLTNEGYLLIQSIFNILESKNSYQQNQKWLSVIKEDKASRLRVLSFAALLYPQDLYHHEKIAIQLEKSQVEYEHKIHDASAKMKAKGGLPNPLKKARYSTPSFDVLRMGIKLPKKDADDALEISSAASTFSDVLATLAHGEAGPVKSHPVSPSHESGCSWAGKCFSGGNRKRLVLGRIIKSAGHFWREGLLLSAVYIARCAELGDVDKLLKFASSLRKVTLAYDTPLNSAAENKEFKDVSVANYLFEVDLPWTEECNKLIEEKKFLDVSLRAANMFEQKVAEEGLSEVYAERAILSGFDIMQVLKNVKGPQLGEILHDVSLFQLCQKDATKEDVLEWLQFRDKMSD